MAFSLSREAEVAGYRLAAFDTIGSTSETAMVRAQAGEGGPLWLVSSEQTSGRGRRGNAWQTARGNLAASLLITSDLPAAVIAQLGFVAGVALAEALENVCGEVSGGLAPAFGLKWPNDLLAEKRKLSGILVQTETGAADRRAVVVGIGVNVRHVPEGVDYPTTSLHALGFPCEAEELFVALSTSWVEAASSWDEGRGFVSVRRSWLDRAVGLDGPVTVRLNGERIAGRFETIDEQGQLVLRENNGSRRYVSAGEVHFGQAATMRGEAS